MFFIKIERQTRDNVLKLNVQQINITVKKQIEIVEKM